MAKKLLPKSYKQVDDDEFDDVEKEYNKIMGKPQDNTIDPIETEDDQYVVPSDSPFNVFLMCQPVFVSDSIENNIWMKKLGDGPESHINRDIFMAEWYSLYSLIATDSLVYLIPPVKGLGDQVYVNCMMYLPHYTKKQTIILSNFTAEGRAGEEVAAGELLTKLGYDCVKSPWNFEGDAECKFLRDDIYFGGHGIRTDKRTYDWIQDTYGGNIITLENNNEFLYHLDCCLFVLNKETVMVNEELGKANIKKIERVANVELVSNQDCMECICNSVKVGDIILNASSLQYMMARDKDYNKEYSKNKRLLEICEKLGLELIYVPFEQAARSGAALSCAVGRLNFR